MLGFQFHLTVLAKKYIHHKNEIWMNDQTRTWVNCTSQEIFGEADHCQNSVPIVAYSIAPHLSYWNRVHEYLCPPRMEEIESVPLTVEYLPTNVVKRY